METVITVQLLDSTNNPERTVAAAAWVCTHADPNMPVEYDYAGLLQRVLDMRHYSVLRHASFTALITGLSRTATHQLVRHATGTAYSQQSQRYLDLTSASAVDNCVIPPSIAKHADASLKMKFLGHMVDCHELYAEFVDAGVPQEDARFVLANAEKSPIVITLNFQALRNLAIARLCTCAQWEIREAIDQLLSLGRQIAPALCTEVGPPCIYGDCPEGKRCCGKQREMREKYLVS